MHYVLPTLIVALPIVAFFAAGRAGFRSFGRLQVSLRLLAAAILLAAAAIHLKMPQAFAAAIPPAFPHRYALAIVSGLLEAAGGIGLFLPFTRRAAALCLAILMVAIFPANIYIAGQTIGPLHMPGVPVRGALQMVFITVILLGGWGWPASKKT